MKKAWTLGLCWTVLPSFFFDGGRIEDPTKKKKERKKTEEWLHFPPNNFSKADIFFCLSARLQITLCL
jgi:hypothetical protein